jgi:hypothetical protein
VLTLSIRIGQPLSEADRRTLAWIRERLRAGLPITDVHLLDEDGNEVTPTRRVHQAPRGKNARAARAFGM